MLNDKGELSLLGYLNVLHSFPAPRETMQNKTKLCKGERGFLCVFFFFFSVGLACFFCFFFFAISVSIFYFCCEGKLLCEGIRSGPLTAR